VSFSHSPGRPLRGLSQVVYPEVPVVAPDRRQCTVGPVVAALNAISLSRATTRALDFGRDDAARRVRSSPRNQIVCPPVPRVA